MIGGKQAGPIVSFTTDYKWFMHDGAFCIFKDTLTSRQVWRNSPPLSGYYRPVHGINR